MESIFSRELTQIDLASAAINAESSKPAKITVNADSKSDVDCVRITFTDDRVRVISDLDDIQRVQVIRFAQANPSLCVFSSGHRPGAVGTTTALSSSESEKMSAAGFVIRKLKDGKF